MQHRLPPELWSHVFTFLSSPSSLCNVSTTSRVFNNELIAPHADPIWQRLWDASARLVSSALPDWAHVPGRWRQQVAASYHLLRLPALVKSCQFAPRCVCVPPRYARNGDVLEDDAMLMPGGRIDIEDVMGRATCVQAMGKVVVIGFECGLGLLIRPGALATKPRPKGLFGKKLNAGVEKRPAFYYDDAKQVNDVLMFASRPTVAGYVIAVTSNCNVIRIEVDLGKHRPLRWTLLDTFMYENGTPLQVAVSEDDRYALIGFSDGRVRMVDIEHGGCRVAFNLAEPVELLAASSKWALAANTFQPIVVAVWDLTEHHYAHTCSQASPGWGKVTTIAGLTATRSEDHFALWNGYNAIRILNAKTGEFARVININSAYSKVLRTAADEGDHGAASAQFGRGRMVLTADKKKAAVAASNRVFWVSIERGRGWSEMRQLDEARRSTVALSNDDRVLVTAEGKAYGGLGGRILGYTSLASSPRLRFWETESGRLAGEVDVLSPVTSVSVCGDTVAAVCEAVGQIMVFFGRPQ